MKHHYVISKGMLIVLSMALSYSTLAVAVGSPPATPKSKSSNLKLLTPNEGERLLDQLAEEDTQKVTTQSFEQFKQSVYKEPFANGKYIVNGDTAIADEKQLREFFDNMVNTRASNRPTLRIGAISNTARLTLALDFNGRDIVWNTVDKKKLSYCVSSTFASNYQTVVNAMLAATQAWEKEADVRFIHDSSQDNNCQANNTKVLFDVNPVNVNGEYLARAFFPNEARSTRNVLIDASSFQLNPSGKLTLTGILRHELGHTLGFRHEHTRPEAGACFEDNRWRGVTNYDAFSVMHYPQCNGKGDWSLTLTDNDKRGVALVYGRPNSVPEPVTDNTKITKKFTNQTVLASKEKFYGSFAVEPNTIFTVNMVGNGRKAGDPDLYVSFGTPPSTFSYACRPFITGANERCAVTVPVTAVGQAFVMVRGFTAANYNLTIEYFKPR